MPAGENGRDSSGCRLRNDTVEEFVIPSETRNPYGAAIRGGRDSSGYRLRNDTGHGCGLHDKCHLFSLGEEPLSCLQRLINSNLL